jgi:biopolymer transport protein TolR
MTPLRSGRRKTRPMSDINVVPYIDVMLVLLVIFMVTAPLIPASTIELAKAGGTSSAPSAYVEVQIEKNGTIAVKRSDSKEVLKKNLTRKTVTPVIMQARGSESLPVVITADRTVPYGDVASILGQLKEQIKDGNSAARVGLMVRPEQ